MEISIKNREKTVAIVSHGAFIKAFLTKIDGKQMGLALSSQIKGLLNFWSKNKPDLVIVLGDRGEMLAAAIASTSDFKAKSER